MTRVKTLESENRMPIKDVKSVEAMYQGKPVRGIYRREIGTFEVSIGATTLTPTEYEYSFDFTVGGKRFRSVFGKESENGKIGANKKWQSKAVENAVEALVRYRANAETGTGPTSRKEELELARLEAEEKRRKERREKTVLQLVEAYLEDISISAPNIKSNKPRTIIEYRLNLYRDVVPAIGTRKAKSIAREDIDEIIGKIVRRGKFVQANRTLSACSRLFNWALSKGLVLYNPCAQMKKYKEIPRNRVLTEPDQKSEQWTRPRHEEIKHLWEKLTADENRTESRILRLCILLGARPGEICNMQWEELNQEWWTVDAKNIKTDVNLECYLTPTARFIIGNRQNETARYVFPMANDETRPLPEDRLSKYVRETNQYFGLAPWQPRDLRRTFSTLCEHFGVADKIINKAQARTEGTVLERHYNKYQYLKELRELFGIVEKEILRIIGQPPTPAKVINLRNR